MNALGVGLLAIGFLVGAAAGILSTLYLITSASSMDSLDGKDPE